MFVPLSTALPPPVLVSVTTPEPLSTIVELTVRALAEEKLPSTRSPATFAALPPAVSEPASAAVPIVRLCPVGEIRIPPAVPTRSAPAEVSIVAAVVEFCWRALMLVEAAASGTLPEEPAASILRFASVLSGTVPFVPLPWASSDA